MSVDIDMDQDPKTREDRVPVLELAGKLRAFIMSCPLPSTTGPQTTPLASGSFRLVARHNKHIPTLRVKPIVRW
jgi:hypothetical protein